MEKMERPSAKINTMSKEQFVNLPIGTKLVESFGSSYRYLRLKKVSDTEYAGMECFLNHDTGEWENREIEKTTYKEGFGEIEVGDFNEKDFPEFFN